MNSCECCFTDFLAKCETEIVINTNLTPGNTYRWVISDKFGHLYEGTAIAEDDGSLIIPIEDVPAGIFTQYSSDFNLQIYSENSCSPIKFKLTGEYDCVTFNIHGGTFVKNTIGCETTFELVEGGGAMVMGAVGAGDAEGGVITGNSLSLHKATGTHPGLVGVDGTTQTFGGPKSFAGTVQFQNLATFESIQKIILSAKPSAPPVGYGLIYPKADKRLYFLNSDDVEFDLGETGGGGIEDVTLAELSTLVSGEDLVPGTSYKITDGDALAPLGVILTATSNKAISNSGVGGFLNADFQQVGDYSGVTGYTLYDTTDVNGGVWRVAKEATLINGNIIIRNMLHFKVIDAGAFSGQPPENNGDAYELLPASIANAYIEEWDFVVYLFRIGDDSAIIRRIDKRKNDISSPLSRFQWGDDNVDMNTKIGSGTFISENSIGVITNNTVINAEFEGGSYEGGECSGNIVHTDATFDVTSSTGVHKRNTTIGHSIFNASASGGSTDFNSVGNESNLIISGVVSGMISHNDFETGSNVTIEGTVTAFTKNKFWLGFAGATITDPNLTAQLNGVAP